MLTLATQSSSKVVTQPKDWIDIFDPELNCVLWERTPPKTLYGLEKLRLIPFPVIMGV
jgi:hypothetical protein